MEPSPNFRSMYPQQNRQRSSSGVLGGLLPDNPQAYGAAPKIFGILPEPSPSPAAVSQSPPAPVPQMSPPNSPSRASLLNRPASTQYARTPPPATSPAQVWKSPSAGDAYRQPSLAQTLLDDPANGVAAGMNDAPMNMPVPLPPMEQVYSPPPPEAGLIGGGANGPLAVRQPEYMTPLAYLPLQPSRRYEVL